MTDRERDPHAAGDTDVRDNLEAARVQALGKVDEQAIRFAGQDGPGVHALARVAFSNLQEVDEHTRALVAQAVTVNLRAVQGGNKRQVAAYDAQDLGERVRTLLARQDAEVVNDPPVRGLREPDGQDERFAGQASHLIGADDNEGLRGRGIEERGQAGLVGLHALQGLADALRVPLGQSDDREGTLRGLDRVFDDGVDNCAHLGGGRLDRVRTGRGHARRLHPAGGHGRVRGGPRDGDTGVLVAVAGEQQGDLIVEAARTGLDAHNRQDARQLAGRAAFRGAGQIVDHDQLVATRDNGCQLGERQAVSAVQDNDVHGTSRRRKGRNHRRHRHEDGQQVAHERVRREQVQVGGSRSVDEQVVQLLVLAGSGRQGVRADSAHARDDLRDERSHLSLIKLAALTHQVLEGGRVHPAERGLGGEHGAQQRGPPRKIELGVDRGVFNLAIGEVQGELVETVSGQALAHLKARGHLASGGRVAGPAFDEGRQALQVGAHQVRLLGREHGGDGVKVITHGVRQGRNLADLRGEDGPRVVAADRAPRVAALLDTNEGTVQVGNVHARAHEVLGLLDEAVALGAAHRNIVVLAPLLGRGCDHHVGGAAFEHAGQEYVEDVGDAVEHGELAVPLGERAGGLDAGLPGDSRDAHAQLGQGLREAVDAQQHVGGLFVGGQDGVAPRGGGGALEGPRRQGLTQQGAGALTLIDRNLVEGLFVQTHAGRGRILAAR